MLKPNPMAKATTSEAGVDRRPIPSRLAELANQLAEIQGEFLDARPKDSPFHPAGASLRCRK